MKVLEEDYSDAFVDQDTPPASPEQSTDDLVDDFFFERALDQVTPELWAEIMKRLPSPRDVCNARIVCTAWYFAFKDYQQSICRKLLGNPRIAPYVTDSRVASERQFSQGMCAARELRSAWRSGAGAQSLFSYESFVRCVKVDWDRNTIAVGLYDGTVEIKSLEPETWSVDAPGSHRSGQVLALDMLGTVLISGSGEPSYHESSCPRASLRVVSLEFLTRQFTGVNKLLVSTRLVHDLGAAQGGHTDSINAVRLVRGLGGLSAVSASSDGKILVWDLQQGKPMRKLLGHRGPVTGLALKTDALEYIECRADSAPTAADARIYSCSHDGVVLEWDWTSGARMRTVLAASTVEPRPLTALSYHAPTNTLAVGSQLGDVCVLRVNPCCTKRDDEMAAYPLTAWHAVGLYSSGGGPRPSPRHEVACVQHDGDKLVAASRSGELQVRWLGALPDEGEPFGCYDSRADLRESAGKVPLGHDSFRAAARACEGMGTLRVPRAGLGAGVRTSVRLYVSSVCFHGGVLVADGFDNQVLVLRLGIDGMEGV